MEDFPTAAERAADGVMTRVQFDAAWDGVIADATQFGAVGATAASATDAWRLAYARVLGDALWLTPWWGAAGSPRVSTVDPMLAFSS